MQRVLQWMERWIGFSPHTCAFRCFRLGRCNFEEIFHLVNTYFAAILMMEEEFWSTGTFHCDPRTSKGDVLLATWNNNVKVNQLPWRCGNGFQKGYVCLHVEIEPYEANFRHAASHLQPSQTKLLLPVCTKICRSKCYLKPDSCLFVLLTGAPPSRHLSIWVV